MGCGKDVDLVASARLLRGFFREHNFPFALCGGLAMAAYGFPLPTFDFDIVTVAEAQNPLVSFLTSQAFELLHRSPGFSNHLHRNLGRVDVVYVRGATAEAIFAAVRQVPGPGGEPFLAVSPEHLVAMKLAALRDDPSRLESEKLALAFLLRHGGVNRGAMRGYFERFGFLGLYRELVGRSDAPQP